MSRCIAVFLAAAVVAGCGSDDDDHGASTGPRPGEPRPVTADEAARLGAMRFNNYRGTGVHVRTEVDQDGEIVRIEGDVDYRARLGYAKVSGAGAAFTLQWNEARLVAWPSAERSPIPPAKLPARTPTRRPLTPGESPVDTVMAALLGLGRDRPDDAGRIRRNGAQFVRRDRIGATTVDVMTSPDAERGVEASAPAARYWVDGSGRLLRLELTLPSATKATRIDIDAKSFMPFARAPQLRRRG